MSPAPAAVPSSNSSGSQVGMECSSGLTRNPSRLWFFAAVGYLAVFTTLVTFLLGQKRAVVVIGPTRMMAYTYLNPALVGLIAWPAI